MRSQRIVDRALRLLVSIGLGDEQIDLVAKDQAHPSVGGAERRDAEPNEVTGGAQRIEVRGAVVRHAGGEDVCLQDRRRHRGPRQDREHLHQPVGAAAVQTDALPGRQEAAERGAVDRLDLGPQHGERAPPQLAQDLRVAPLPLCTARTELPADETAVGHEGVEHGPDAGAVDAEARGHVAVEERSVGAAVPHDQRLERRVDRVGEHAGQPDGDGTAQRVAQTSGVFGGRPPLLACDADGDDPAVLGQGGERRLQIARDANRGTLRQLPGGQRAEHPEEVGDLIRVARQAVLHEALQLPLELLEHVGIQQVPQLLGTEQLPQQVAVERQGGRPPLCQWRIALVHVDGDPAEDQ